MAPTADSKLGDLDRGAQSHAKITVPVFGLFAQKTTPSYRDPREAGETPALCPSQREETKINRVVNGHRTLLKHKDSAPKTDNQIGLFRVGLWPLLPPVHYR